MILPDPGLPWAIPLDAVALIAESEGLRLRAYRCPAGQWTIGWGETDGVHPGDTCTKGQADTWLCEDIHDRAKAVQSLCKVEPSEHELGAMVSLAYNIGLRAFAGSTVLRCHNAGQREAAARAFGLWNKARINGALTTLPGLTARRAREAAMYLTPDDRAALEPVPQAVEAESKMTASPIAQGGASVAGIGGLAAMLGPLGEHVAAVKGYAATVKGFVGETLGVPTEWVLPLVLIALGAVVVRWRLEQRRQGFA